MLTVLAEVLNTETGVSIAVVLAVIGGAIQVGRLMERQKQGDIVTTSIQKQMTGLYEIVRDLSRTDIQQGMRIEHGEEKYKQLMRRMDALESRTPTCEARSGQRHEHAEDEG